MVNSHSSRRPLSPHLQIYSPQMTSTLSILHRMAGFALSLGLIPLTYWLYIAAYQPASLIECYECAGSWWGMALLFGWSLAFYYHLANGIRHLFWDAGKLLELETARKAGFMVLGATLGFTVVTWGYVLAKMPL